jgi:uncharacterized protein HemY
MRNTSVKWLWHILHRGKDREIEIPIESAEINEYNRLIQTAKEKLKSQGRWRQKNLRNVVTYLPNYTASQPKRT